MDLLYESIFVGIYTTILYVFMQFFIKNSIFLLFFLGFFKHFMGYWLGIHDYFCKINCKKSNALFQPVLIQSVLEGCYFFVISYNFFVSYSSIWTRMIFIFFIGFLTNIFAEYFGVHYYFCQANCTLTKNET